MKLSCWEIDTRGDKKVDQDKYRESWKTQVSCNAQT